MRSHETKPRQGKMMTMVNKCLDRKWFLCFTCLRILYYTHDAWCHESIVNTNHCVDRSAIRFVVCCLWDDWFTIRYWDRFTTSPWGLLRNKWISVPSSKSTHCTCTSKAQHMYRVSHETVPQSDRLIKAYDHPAVNRLSFSSASCPLHLLLDWRLLLAFNMT